MALVDQFGRPFNIQRKFARAAEQTPQRPYEPVQIGDIGDLIKTYDWRTLLSASRRLFANMGLPKGAIIQKANYSVGRAWDARYKGTNHKWGAQAEEWLKEQFYPMCSVRGPMFDFKTDLHIDSISIDRDGDFFILLTESETGFPQIQRLGAHRVGQRSNIQKVEKGPYKNLRINNGIILNKVGRPVAYRVLGEDPEGAQDEDISARDLIHVFNPFWYEQQRGLPAAMHAIDKLLTSLRSEEWEEMAMLMVSSIGLIEYNEHGMADPDDPANFFTAPTTEGQSGITTSTFAGGSVRHFKANSGAKLESIKHDRPGDLWEKFQDRLARHFIAGMDWSYAFAWKPAEFNSVSQRVELEKMQKAIEDRQDLLRMPAKRMINYAIAKAIKNGVLPKCDDWFKFDFNMPTKFSIDRGRESAARINEFKVGALNMTTWVGELGRTYEEQIRERCTEIAQRQIIKKEIEDKFGITIDPRELSMMTPNEAPQTDNQEDQNINNNEEAS